MKTKSKSKIIVQNQMKLLLPSFSVNEGIARAATAAFCAGLNPAASEIADIKCAVSEAVTNCIVHAYKGTEKGSGIITINAKLCEGRLIIIEVVDKGCGIPDVKKAREPLFTTDAEDERSGMGFTIMESFTDKLRVSSKPGKGTKVTMYKYLKDGTGL